MNVSIRTKFMGILALQMIAVALVGWLGIAGMGEMDMRIKAIYEYQFVPSRMIAGANSDLTSWKRAILNQLLGENGEKIEAYEQIINLHQNAFFRELESLAATGNAVRRRDGNSQKHTGRILAGHTDPKIICRRSRGRDGQRRRETLLHNDLQPSWTPSMSTWPPFWAYRKPNCLRPRRLPRIVTVKT